MSAEGLTKDFYVAKGLKANKLYYLVETQAPGEYSLLARPALFLIERKDTGNAVIFYDEKTSQPYPNGGSDGLVTSAPGKTDPAYAFIQVADVKTGSLPKTGGNGILPWVLAGVTLILAAFAMNRRRA